MDNNNQNYQPQDNQYGQPQDNQYGQPQDNQYGQPPYGQPPYGQPQYGYQPPRGPQQDQIASYLSIGGLVLGIIGIILAFISSLWGLLLSVAGIVLAAVSKKQGAIGGIPTAGLVVSIVAASLCFLIFITSTAVDCVRDCLCNSVESQLGYDMDDLEDAFDDLYDIYG